MHPYATDSSVRKSVPLYLATLSIGAAYLLHVTLGNVIPWWIDVPSVIGFYGLFYLTFERLLWKMRLLRQLGLIRVPNLNGEWSGYLCSSFDGRDGQHAATLNIRQNWTQLDISMRAEHSRSSSVIATITTSDPVSRTLSYEYINEPRSDAIDTMHSHRGTAMADLSTVNGKWILDGEYYTGRDRLNFGTFHFEK